MALPRIVALSLLDGIGLPWFQGLPAVHFATAAKADNNRTPVYSFRLMASLQLGRDWRATLARIKAPTQIVVGANDELFNAAQFQPLMQSINPRIGVTVVAGEGHLAMIRKPPPMPKNPDSTPTAPPSTSRRGSRRRALARVSRAGVDPLRGFGRSMMAPTTIMRRPNRARSF